MDDSDTARIFGERYVLGDRLTASETREVWQAHDDIVSRAVALKIFFGPEAATPEWQQTFRRRADQLIALSHPGIAKIYEHGESRDEAWLAMAFVAGTPVADRLDGGEPVAASEALDLVGQTALALAAAHDVGVVHGAISPSTLLVRDGGVVSLIGFAIDGGATRDDDINALGTLAAELFDSIDPSTPTPGPDVRQFVASLADPTRAAKERGAKEIGRTALALAGTVDGVPRPTRSAAPKPERPPKHVGYGGAHDEAEKRMVRNRLIVLGTIVVVGGAALLRFVGEGAGDVTVPLVTNLTLDQAELKLTTDGMRSNEHCTLGASSGDVVVSQSPAAGRSIKAGSVVTLTYTKDTCP